MNKINFDYNEILSDSKKLHEILYTPLSEAIKILEERQKDTELQKKIEELLEGDIPDIFKEEGIKGFQFRQIATPNYESQNFIKITKNFNIKTIFCENHEDKFVSKNDFKLSLGQLNINHGINRKDEYIVEKIKIIDLVENDGKKLKDIKTFNGKKLVDFHKELFEILGHKDIYFYDMNNWFENNGSIPEKYYKNLFLLFISHGILFENFLLNKKEYDFTKNIILPNIERVYNVLNIKPLIVPIPPMDLENDDYVIHYDSKIKNYL